jgi:iron complex outermembrane receptor protein
LNTNNRRTFSTPSRIALSVLAILASAADAQAVTEWDLPGQPLATTLRDIAARTESNIIFDKKLVKGQSAPPLKTRATTEEALSKVLEGTGLTYRQLDDKTVTIQLASTDPASATSSSYASDGRIRLAQAETGPAPRPQFRPVPETGLPQVMLLEEIVVTGTNIRGIENNTAPVTVLTREYIDATGYSTAAKLLESVTQNFSLATQYGSNVPNVSGGNTEQGSSVNLRGIGEGTTLVLLNGRRLAPGFRSAAVDISALPLSAIERVEILPDGASALYGSDAVGGVVNFILREDFEGAETRARAGVADGVNEYRASQAVGGAWDSGNALASFEYYQRDQLDANDRDFVPAQSLVGSLAPEDENYSGIFTVRQELGGSVAVFADGLYTDRSSSNRAGRVTFAESSQTDNTQGVGTLGVDWNFAGDWQLELSGSYATNDFDNTFRTRNSVTVTAPITTTTRESTFNLAAGEMKVDGTLFTMSGGPVRAALGVAYRNESYEQVSTNRTTNVVTFNIDSDQNISSAFGEVYVPVVGDGNAFAGVRRLELSIAGRYDDYSTAGSSFDPQAGLMWEPVTGLRLRARHSTSYKAPNLVEYDVSQNIAIAGVIPVGGVPTGLLQLAGTDVNNLSPQESESSSFGLELSPENIPSFSFAANYYKIRYTDMVATPAGGNALLALNNPAVYNDIIIRNPSADQVNQTIGFGQLGLGFTTLPNIRPFTPGRVNVIVDLRRRNLSEMRAEGVDLSTQYDIKIGTGTIYLGLNGTYILNQEQKVTDTSPELDVVDTIFNPPDWRARALLGWQWMGFAANLFVNHSDSYTDSRLVTRPQIDAYTTVDMRIGYDFSSRFSTGVLSGFTVALSAQNVLDEDPPKVTVTGTPATPSFDAGFDPTNANPFGRFIALEFVKSW